MVNAIKRMDKKFLILAGLVICLPLFIIIFLAIIQGCGDTKISYEEYEKKMLTAAEKYIEAKKIVPNDEGELVEVKLTDLVDGEYIKSTEKLLDDTSCKGSVSVRRNGSSIESNNGGYLDYIVNLECNDYETISLVDKLRENVVTQDSGLYQVGDSYIFKGNKTNNYITFFGQSYRIVSVDKDGVLKLVKADPETATRVWDNKFNVDTNRPTGKNIYKDSRILEYLLNDYSNDKKISPEAKKNIVAYDVCVGKRNATNYAIDSSIDCSEVLEKQVVSLLNVSDYAKASLDTDCVDLRSRSCNNYNYLYGSVSSTWTLNTSLDTTYDVIFLSSGLMEVMNANSYNEYNIVIYIDGNQIYKSGVGTLNNPYVVE